MGRTTDRRVPVQVRTPAAEPTEAPRDEARITGERVVDPPISAQRARNAVLAQLIGGTVSGVGAIVFALILAGFPMAAAPGVFFEPSPGQMMPTLPLLMVALLWALAAAGALVPAVRIGRLVRWSAIDADTSPVHPLLARLGGLGLYLLVGLSLLALPLGWWVFG